MSTSSLLLFVAIISFIAGCLIALIIFIVMKRKRSEAETPSDAPPGEEENEGEKGKEKEGEEEGRKEGGNEGDMPSDQEKVGKVDPADESDLEKGGDLYE